MLVVHLLSGYGANPQKVCWEVVAGTASWLLEYHVMSCWRAERGGRQRSQYNSEWRQSLLANLLDTLSLVFKGYSSYLSCT